jgi:RNA polymerase sigma-70 factor (ECF subfamily)
MHSAAVVPDPELGPGPVPKNRQRLAELVEAHWERTGRLLRHLGVGSADFDDAMQQVFLTLDSKLEHVRTGAERSFLASCAVHIAARYRRARGRRREVNDDEVWELSDPSADPEQALQRREQLQRLDAILNGMAPDLRTVFVLYEIEELTMAEIAKMLDLAPGTVASRLRRARELFQEQVGT